MPKAQKSARVPEFITRPYCRRRLLNLIQAAAVDTAFQSSARPMVGLSSVRPRLEHPHLRQSSRLGVERRGSSAANGRFPSYPNAYS